MCTVTVAAQEKNLEEAVMCDIALTLNGIALETYTLTVEPVSADVTVDDVAFNKETGTLTVTSPAEAQTFQIDVTGKVPEGGTVDYITPDGTAVRVDEYGKITVAADAEAGTHEIEIRVNGILVDTITVSVTAA